MRQEFLLYTRRLDFVLESTYDHNNKFVYSEEIAKKWRQNEWMLYVGDLSTSSRCV